MNSAAFKGREAADTTALLHELAARGCKKKQQSKCKVVFPSRIYSSLQNNTPHEYESITYKDAMLFKRLSGMWTVRYTERLTYLADYAMKDFRCTDIWRIVLLPLLLLVMPAHSGCTDLCTPSPCCYVRLLLVTAGLWKHILFPGSV